MWPLVEVCPLADRRRQPTHSRGVSSVLNEAGRCSRPGTTLPQCRILFSGARGALMDDGITEARTTAARLSCTNGSASVVYWLTERSSELSRGQLKTRSKFSTLRWAEAHPLGLSHPVCCKEMSNVPRVRLADSRHPGTRAGFSLRAERMPSFSSSDRRNHAWPRRVPA
jgi:hypothetical protein